MIDLHDYKKFLSLQGQHLGEVRKNESDMIMNATFTGDIAYRKVYILSKEEGWQFVDAKFSKHVAASTSKDAVDSYLQFRPKVHYPVGTYVFIPDDTNYHLTVSPIPVEDEQEKEDQVCPKVEEEITYDINGEDPLWDGAKNLWLIVGRTDSKQFVRYLGNSDGLLDMVIKNCYRVAGDVIDRPQVIPPDGGVIFAFCLLTL